MTALLVSVASVDEALLAIQGGADFIDLKDPAAGALGALQHQVIDEIGLAVGGRKQVSATIGDLPMQPEVISNAITTIAELPVDYIKIGFFTASDEAYEQCLTEISSCADQGLKLIAVLFADIQYPYGLIGKIIKAGVVGVMLDTSQKDGRVLFDYWDASEINHFADAVKRAKLLFGLAGSLQKKHIAQVKEFQPDYIGFRGGVCDLSDRTSHLSLSRIQEVSKLL